MTGEVYCVGIKSPGQNVDAYSFRGWYSPSMTRLLIFGTGRE